MRRMPSIPVYVSLYQSALLALAVSLAVSAFGRQKKRQGWVVSGLSLACLLGWAALEPLGRLRVAALMPSIGPAMLIVPAAGVLAVELVRRWRGGRNDRWLSVIAAGGVGWWLARVTAGPAEVWRVGIITAALVGLIAWSVRRQPGRSLALALAVCGGLVVTGFPGPWIVAAAVLVAACAGPLALRVPAVLPSAIVAALVAGADLARGRLARGHVNTTDIACLFAVAAPLLVGIIEKRLGKRWILLAPVLAAAVVVVLAWGARRFVTT